MHHRTDPVWSRCARGAVPLLALLALAACGGGSGSAGAPGLPGDPGASTGVLEGTVTNSVTGQPVANVTVTLDPAVGAHPVTGSDGFYTATLPVGSYTATCAATADYQASSSPVSVLAAQTTTRDFALTPTAPVTVRITGVPVGPAPGDSFTLAASVTVRDGSTVLTYGWEQASGAPAAIAAPSGATTLVTLGLSDAYKASLLAGVEELDRWRVMPVSPHAEVEGAATELDLHVTTTSGTYHASATVAVHLPFADVSSGLANVPIGRPVLLGGKAQSSWTWTFGTKPGLSAATLQDAGTRYPWFVPDVAGKYTLDVLDTKVAPPVLVHVDAWASEWVGAVDGIDADGRPLAQGCTTFCHSIYFPEKFAQWADSGHASVFTDNVNTGGHYGPSCFSCHTVGYDPGRTNGGLDDAAGYPAFLAGMFPGGFSHPDPDNWTEVLATWPDVARRANIQCESCHGPNGTGGGHVQLGLTPDPRISTSADVCGACHGEPPRHGRFQQWETSAHGNFETAIAEGTQGSCNKCHSAQGFLAWKDLGFDKAASTPAPSANDVQPITCVVCHDPHSVGQVSGSATDAPLRVEGETPDLMAGFRATDVGKGAMCMICHNARRGLKNDSTGLGSSPDQAPHSGPQTDVLMGQNAFFVTVGQRSDHGWIGDTCVTCHVSLSPPPADLSYNLGGTNHSFAADPAICTKCHGAFDGGTVEAWFEGTMAQLQGAIAEEIRAEMQALLSRGYTLTLTPATGAAVDVGPTSAIGAITPVESHGRSAMDVVIDGVPVLEVQLSKAVVKSSTGASVGSLVSNALFVGDDPVRLGKANWNYYLLHSDGSKSFHNPAFAEQILNATLTVLGNLAWAPPTS